MPSSGNRAADQRAGQKEVEEARRMINAGNYSVVIPRLLHVISKYPDSAAALEARYLLGVTNHQVRNFREAIEQLEEYLRLAPDGPRAESAEQLVAKLTEEYESRFLTAQNIDAQLREIQEALEADPGDTEKQLQKANLYWARGDYEQAGRMYFQLAQEHPEYAQHETIRSRIEIHAEDEYTVLSPRELQRRAIAEEPLVIVNTASYRAGRDRYTREPTHYVVTGQALNRGDTTLNGVQVHVTLYGFGGMVFDATTENIGRLNPGQRRAFSVRFSNFENIENITRFECEGTYQ